MKLFSFFKGNHKTCEDCEHYSEYKTEVKLLPNKTVVQSKLMAISCKKMNLLLEDTNICPMFRERTGNTSARAHAMSLYLRGTRND
jgi:hypothetical protein